MGLFNKVRDTYKQNQAKRAITLVNAEYMGGYGDKKKTIGNLLFNEEVVEFKVALNKRASFSIPTVNIRDVAIEGKDEVSRRVTVTRLLAIGIFAFALKKKGDDKEAFITLELTSGEEVIFNINNKSPMELKAIISKFTLQIRQNKQA